MNNFTRILYCILYFYPILALDRTIMDGFESIRGVNQNAYNRLAGLFVEKLKALRAILHSRISKPSQKNLNIFSRIKNTRAKKADILFSARH